MEKSLDDLLSLLNKWKSNGNTLRILFEQSGQTNVSIKGSATRVSIDKADRESVVFAFGTGLAEGTLVIPLSKNKIVNWRIVDPQNKNSLTIVLTLPPRHALISSGTISLLTGAMCARFLRTG